jgi:septal ring factor EnvC (AmiA/AmiB activator)
MNRRDFISKLSKTAATAGAAAAAVAAYPPAKQAVTSSVGAMQREVKALNKRIDAMQDSQKKILTALIFVASVSTGMDFLTLLKGDIV